MFIHLILTEREQLPETEEELSRRLRTSNPRERQACRQILEAAECIKVRPFLILAVKQTKL